jgi:hypothetical protein
MWDVEYNLPCPECQKENKTAGLGFDSGYGMITCNGETRHEFANLPGESAPVVEDSKVPATGEFAPTPSVPQRDFTPEEEAALDKAMLEPPRARDFSSQVVTDTQPQIPPQAQREAQEHAVAGTIGNVLAEFSGHVETSELVGLGGMVLLPNGDALAGVRIEEKWVSAMQSEGENQTPPKNAAEYLQEIIDQGLLSWHMATPAAL